MLKPADVARLAALADHSSLEPYDGRDVVRVDLKITNAGDGLSAALAVAPRPFHLGEELTIVLKGTVSQLGYKPVDPDDDESPLALVPTVKAGSSVILSEAAAAKMDTTIAKSDDLIRKAHEAAQGIARLEHNGVTTDPPEAVDDLDDGEQPEAM